MKKLIIDLSECVLCDICVEVCPDVFIKNDAGYIEIIESNVTLFFEDDINEAIKNCRGDCLSWDEEA